MNEDHPLAFAFIEIEKALAAQLPYVAVAAALGIPDICSALESPNGEAHGSRYKGWYNAYVAARYPLLTDEDCYSIKRGVVHAGRFGPAGNEYGRVEFVSRGSGHNFIAEDALQLDASHFCRDVIAAARAWYARKNADTNVVMNLPRLLRIQQEHVVDREIETVPIQTLR